MYRFWQRWTVPFLVMVAIVVFVTLPVFGQRADPQPTGKPYQMKEIVKLTEMAKLTETGQLTLRTAIELAEKHTKGQALQASCEVRRAKPKGDPSPGKVRDPIGARLIYTVCCYADKQIFDVRIDGKDRKILDVKERKTPKTDDQKRP